MERFRASLLRALPFEAVVVMCDGGEFLRMVEGEPFGSEAAEPEAVRFVSILERADGVRAVLPVAFPAEGDWLVRVVGQQGQFVFGMYRRHMKTIGYLAQMDKLFGVPATTRNWNTVLAVTRALKQGTERRAQRVGELAS